LRRRRVRAGPRSRLSGAADRSRGRLLFVAAALCVLVGRLARDDLEPLADHDDEIAKADGLQARDDGSWLDRVISVIGVELVQAVARDAVGGDQNFARP